MKIVKIELDKEKNRINKDKNQLWIRNSSIIQNYIIIIVLIINSIIIIYLLIENINNSKIIREIIDFKNTFDDKNNIFINLFPNNDKDLIGLNYPDINFDSIKIGLQKFNIISSLINLINQLEMKIIYLEKEINVTKLVSFYTSRSLFQKENGIIYDETNITDLYQIVNWIIIHKSNQLKGIASDKYLACKYAKLKLGRNICDQRITTYEDINQINYNEISKYGNIVLKISNSCWKNIFIYNNSSKKNFEDEMKKLKNLMEYEHGLIEAQFFHLYAKRRIIVEKQFFPLSDLNEFKIYIVNNDIKFIVLRKYIDRKLNFFFYDKNFNMFNEKQVHTDINPLNNSKIFKKNILKTLKKYAIILSEDFPNFIRVDLYVFHDNIYLSELTFAAHSGKPVEKHKIIANHSVLNFSRKDN